MFSFDVIRFILRFLVQYLSRAGASKALLLLVHVGFRQHADDRGYILVVFLAELDISIHVLGCEGALLFLGTSASTVVSVSAGSGVGSP